MHKEIVKSHLIDYLIFKKIEFKKSGSVTMIKCPICNKQPMSANIIPNTNIINCFTCNKKYDIIELSKILDKDTIDVSNESIVIDYLNRILNLGLNTEIQRLAQFKILEKYERLGFDLVPVGRICPDCKGKGCSKCENTGNYGKNPIELDWTNKSHKNIEEWKNWIEDELNIGIKTGKISNITVLDIDQNTIPEELKKLLGNTMFIKTNKGYHYIYQYEDNLSKTRIQELKLDIENNGGQIVVYPSRVINKLREVPTFNNIEKMSDELLHYLNKFITIPLKTNSEKIREDIEQETFKLDWVQEGQRNSSLIRLGGILRKELNINQTGYVLSILNKLLNNPLPSKEINSMLNQLDRYVNVDEKELAHKIMEYLKDVEEATRGEIALAVTATNRGEDKKRVDKALNYLCKEGYIIKRGNRYILLRKIEWKESLVNIGKPVNFKMPYFEDIANFNIGDLILIGSRQKIGKTTIAINILKRLVMQGVKPYYISLEPGSRFAKTSMQLGLKEGDFKWTFCADPSQIQLENNAVTIIDWLLISDKSQTDMVFKHFVEQLEKTKGFLIVFQQLKDDDSWFAPSMAKQFPALSTRYIYDTADNGEYGKFILDPMRDPRLNIKNYNIPCKYIWETKELKRIDEIEEQ